MPKDNEEEKDKGILVLIIGGLAGVLAWIFLRGRAQADPDKAILYGQVTDIDTGALLQGISVNCNGYTTSTDAAGEYRIINIEPGTYSVTFEDPLGRYQPLTI